MVKSLFHSSIDTCVKNDIFTISSRGRVRFPEFKTFECGTIFQQIVRYIKDNPELLQDSPSYCLNVISKGKSNISNIKKSTITDEIIRCSIIKDVRALQHISHRPYKLCILAVQLNPSALIYLTEDRRLTNWSHGWTDGKYNYTDIRNICTYAINAMSISNYETHQSIISCIIDLRNADENIFTKEMDEVLITKMCDFLITHITQLTQPDNQDSESDDDLDDKTPEYDKIIIDILKKYPKYIKYIEHRKHLRNAPLLKFVSICPQTFKYLDKQTNEICEVVVKSNGMCLKYCDKQNDALCTTAVRNNGEALEFVWNKTIDICTEAALTDIRAFKYIPTHLVNVIIISVAIRISNPYELPDVDCQVELSDDQIDIFIKNDIYMIKYLSTYKEHHAIYVVSNDGRTLKYIRNQTEQICIEAVKEYGLALPYVINQTENICYEAVLNCPMSFVHVIDKTEKICLAALKQCGTLLRFIQNPTLEMCQIAVDTDPSASLHVPLKFISLLD